VITYICNSRPTEFDTEAWRDLDARLRAVEARLGVEPATGDRRPDRPAASADAQAFWVLEGLRERLAGSEGGEVVFAGMVETAAGSASWQHGTTTEALLDVDEGAGETAAARLSALGHPVRLRLLLAVLRGHTSPVELAELDGVGLMARPAPNRLPDHHVGDAALATLAREVVGEQQPALAVAAVTGEVTRTATIGAGLDDRFEIGSISKGLTGLLFADMIGRGEVTAGTRVGDLIPLGGSVAEVTLAQA
jgi:CubicO group peptidase (beta-lactamase class C family)